MKKKKTGNMDELYTYIETLILPLLRGSRWVKMDYTYKRGIIDFEMVQKTRIGIRAQDSTLVILKNLNDDT